MKAAFIADRRRGSCVLYALRDYREWSQRLAHPALLPWARRVCELLSENRLQMSRWLDAIPTCPDTPICSPALSQWEKIGRSLAFSRTLGRAEAPTSIFARKKADKSHSFSLWEKVNDQVKIVIPGGSGQVGQVLARAFLKDDHEVIVLTRQPLAKAAGRAVFWDGRTLEDWAEEFEAADVVINLAGKSVNCRYTSRNRAEITRSRVDSTRAVGQAIARAQRPPRLWLQAATATIYAHRYDAANDEASGIVGGNERNVPETWRFSIDVAKAWERAFNEASPLPLTRKVLMRSAVILSPDRDGIFDVLLGLVRHGLGGQSGGRPPICFLDS